MIPPKLTREELAELALHEPTKIIRDYAEYERRYDEMVARQKARQVTLAEVDAQVRTRFLKDWPT